MYLCLCHGVSDKKVKSLLKQGIRSVPEIQDRLAVGMSCGTCLNDLRKMIQEAEGSSGGALQGPRQKRSRQGSNP